MRVLSIGAGLGGLTLAHGLRRAGHDVIVAERSSRDGATPATYGIHLNADGLRALHSCLPQENWAAVDAAGRAAPNVVKFHDPHSHNPHSHDPRSHNPHSGELARIDKRFTEHENDPITHRRAITRDDLREALLMGIADDIRWSHRCVGYNHSDGEVVAQFDNDSTIHCDLLVGADGSNSVIRHQRLPELERVDLGITNIAGSVDLDAALATRLGEALTDGSINNFVPAGDGWLFLSTWPVGGAQRIVWAWANATDRYALDPASATPAELHDLVVQATKTWNHVAAEAITATPTTAVTAIGLRTMPTLPTWEPDAITLIGDAIHNMTPMAGIGANTALRDAEQLCVALASDSDITAAVVTYEQVMREYANAALALSTRNAMNAARANPFNRRVFRTLLRISRRVRPLRNAMFGPTIR